MATDRGPSLQFSLYVKASAIDKMSQGADPICQQFSLMSWLLARSHSEMEFKIFSVQADCPPKHLLPDAWSNKFPLVIVESGLDKNGKDLSGTTYDTFEDLELFFESINTECRELKRNNMPNRLAMVAVKNVFLAFNHFLGGQPDTNLVAELKKLDDYLERQDTRYLVDDVMSFSDCHLIPRLQHIRVAGKAYRDFDIPKEFSYVWRYLVEVYEHDAFTTTMPSDQDIVFFYENKAKVVVPPKRRSLPTLEKFSYLLEIPEECVQNLPDYKKRVSQLRAPPISRRMESLEGADAVFGPRFQKLKDQMDDNIRKEVNHKQANRQAECEE